MRDPDTATNINADLDPADQYQCGAASATLGLLILLWVGTECVRTGAVKITGLVIPSEQMKIQPRGNIIWLLKTKIHSVLSSQQATTIKWFLS
jgi:hypothetical protein